MERNEGQILRKLLRYRNIEKVDTKRLVYNSAFEAGIKMWGHIDYLKKIGYTIIPRHD